MMKLNILQKRIERLEELFPKITDRLVQVFENDDNPKQKIYDSNDFNKLVYEYRDTKERYY